MKRDALLLIAGFAGLGALAYFVFRGNAEPVIGTSTFYGDYTIPTGGNAGKLFWIWHKYLGNGVYTFWASDAPSQLWVSLEFPTYAELIAYINAQFP